jgi:hypothetical protein
MGSPRPDDRQPAWVAAPALPRVMRRVGPGFGRLLPSFGLRPVLQGWAAGSPEHRRRLAIAAPTAVGLAARMPWWRFIARLRRPRRWAAAAFEKPIAPEDRAISRAGPAPGPGPATRPAAGPWARPTSVGRRVVGRALVGQGRQTPAGPAGARPALGRRAPSSGPFRFRRIQREGVVGSPPGAPGLEAESAVPGLMPAKDAHARHGGERDRRPLLGAVGGLAVRAFGHATGLVREWTTARPLEDRPPEERLRPEPRQALPTHLGPGPVVAPERETFARPPVVERRWGRRRVAPGEARGERRVVSPLVIARPRRVRSPFSIFLTRIERFPAVEAKRAGVHQPAPGAAVPEAGAGQATHMAADIRLRRVGRAAGATHTRRSDVLWQAPPGGPQMPAPSSVRDVGVAAGRRESAETGVARTTHMMQTGALRRAARLDTLPSWSLPLARRLVPAGSLPAVATGPEVTRHLKAAGVRAAATGSTIYLERPPDRGPESVEVLAHELSHVADRPVLPRFFMDRAADADEERARAVGRAAGSEATREWSWPQVRGRAGGPPAEASLSISPAASAMTVFRSPEGGEEAAAPITAAPLESAAAAPEAAPETVTSARGARQEAEVPLSDLNSMLSGLLEALEERMLRELERRGGRFAGVF